MNFGPWWNRWCLSANGPLDASTSANLVGGANPCRRAKSSPPFITFCAPAANGKRCQRNLAVPAPFTNTSKPGTPRVFLCAFGAQGWRSMTKWWGSPGNGKALMGPWAKLLWPKNAPAPTRRIGEKKGRKRSVLTDGRGVPLSIVGSAANVNDVVLLAPTLDKIVAPRPAPTPAAPQNLCADAGYRGEAAKEVVLQRHYTPHVKQRREEAEAKRTQPGFKARRWVVERTHSWMNRFRKLLVSFEKTEFSYNGLLCLAAATICWRQTISIYG